MAGSLESAKAEAAECQTFTDEQRQVAAEAESKAARLQERLTAAAAAAATDRSQLAEVRLTFPQLICLGFSPRAEAAVHDSCHWGHATTLAPHWHQKWSLSVPLGACQFTQQLFGHTRTMFHTLVPQSSVL